MGCLCVAVSSQTDVHYSTVYHEAENENAVTSKKELKEGSIMDLWYGVAAKGKVRSNTACMDSNEKGT